MSVPSRRPPARGATAVALALALAGCVAAEAVPRTSASVGVDPDEARLWQLAGEVEARIAERATLHGDPDLEAYVHGVAVRLVDPGALAAVPLRVRVLVDARPGAFALPNGAVYLHTGLLARLESEAELAALLAHELAHVTHRHVLREWRRAQDWTKGSVGLAHLASTRGYSRQLEHEADAESIARMRAAGYDPGAAVTLLERLRAWAAEEGLKDEGGPYASHPRLGERIDSCRALLAGAVVAEARAAEGDGYRRRGASVLLPNARLELAAGRYAAAREQARRHLELAPDDAGAHVLVAESARRSGGAGDAIPSYRRALELDPRSAEAWRGLGLALARTGALDEGRAAFARYLELAPDAPDRAHVEAALARPGGEP